MATDAATAPKVESAVTNGATSTASSSAATVTTASPAAPAAAAATAPAAAKDAASPASAAPWMKPEAAQPEVKKDEPKAEVKYELKAPEGVPMDAAAIEGYVSFAKENGLTPAQAQKILERDVEAKKSQDEALWKSVREADEKNLKEIQTAWGDKFGEYSEDVKRAFDYVDPDGAMRKDMERVGVAHYRPLVEAFKKFGGMIKNDSLRSPSIAGPAAKDERTPHEKARDYYAKKMAEQQGKVVRR